MKDDWDVAIVGYGPVGMVMAALLGKAGHRVVVLERYANKYNLPRAAIFDDETMRTFARLGIAERLLPKIHAQRNYEWCNAVGELLIEHDFAEFGRSGWAEWYMMYQPDLEDALDDLCQSLPNVSVRFDAPVAAIKMDNDGVSLTIEGGEIVSAVFVVGCDGGNSFVKRALHIPQEDYGFSEPWMVCDFRLKGPTDVPMARQVCDPVQPISIISLGPQHHRFSFMLGADDDPEIERQSHRVWRRVAKYLQTGEAELIRAVTYTFRSLVARDWRVGRVVLAGDSAHQMPPFLGQGMCSGIRDALNLSWKFDMILAGRRNADLLDSYQSEREGHVRTVIEKGIELGRVQTMRDPAAAAARDSELIAKRQARTKPEKIRFPPLGEGAFGTGPGSRELIVQGFGCLGERTDRFDALMGYGFFLLCRDGADQFVGKEQRDALDAAGVRLVSIGIDGDSVYQDTDNTYGRWFDEHGIDFAAVRPDFHVWGTAKAGDGSLNTLISSFVAFSDPLNEPSPEFPSTRAVAN